MPEAPRQLTSGQRPTPCGRVSALSKPPGAGKPWACRPGLCPVLSTGKFPGWKKKARDSQGRKEKSHQLAPCAEGGSTRAEPPQGIENPPAAVKPDLALLTSSFQPTLTHPGVLAAQEP